jgi:tetratricopeptide (TPR) repeat protein
MHMLAELGDDPYASDIEWRLGSYYLAQGRLDDAMLRFDQTLGVIPDHGMALPLKGITLLQIAAHGRRQGVPVEALRALYMQAADCLDRSAARAGDVDMLLAAAEAHARAGQSDIAMECLERAVAMDSKRVDIQLRLGQLYYELGQTDAGQQLLGRLIQQVPGLAAQHEQILQSWMHPTDPWIPSP